MKELVRTLGLVVALLLCGAAAAETVTPAQAVSAAKAWLAESGGAFAAGRRVVGTAQAGRDDAGNLRWYEVPLTDGGCVITAPDGDIEPVLAVIDDWPGEIPADHPLRALLVRDVSNRLETIAANLRTGATNALAQAVARTRSRWQRLTRPRLATAALGPDGNPARIVCWIAGWRKGGALTHWNQNKRNGEYCYDYYTPNHYPCGCVATAACALLQHFNVTKGESTKKYCSVDGSSKKLSTKGGTYDWSSLPKSWTSSTPLTETQREMIGRAAYDMGVCLGMAYSSGGSGAQTGDIASVLKDKYGFADARFAGSISADHYEKLVYAQLRCGAPVVLSISRRDSAGNRYGHCVLAVGYGEDAAGTAYTRVFMGWSGSGDAWYAFPNVSSYTAVEGVVTMVSVNDDSAALYGRATYRSGDGVPFAKVSYAGNRTTTTDANGYWGVRVSPWNMKEKSAFRSVTCGGVTKTYSVDKYFPYQTFPLYHYDSASTLNGRTPGAVDFTFPNRPGTVYWLR